MGMTKERDTSGTDRQPSLSPRLTGLAERAPSMSARRGRPPTALPPRPRRPPRPPRGHADARASNARARSAVHPQTVRMTDPDEPMLTLDEAYRAAFHFIKQYYEREPITPFVLMLHSMTPWAENGNLRQTSDPATWHDWMSSVNAALASEELPGISGPGDAD